MHEHFISELWLVQLGHTIERMGLVTLLLPIRTCQTRSDHFGLGMYSVIVQHPLNRMAKVWRQMHKFAHMSTCPRDPSPAVCIPIGTCIDGGESSSSIVADP